MKPKTNEEYLARSSRCPFCDSEDIVGEGYDFEEYRIVQVVYCNSCEKSWYDVYLLAKYEEIE